MKKLVCPICNRESTKIMLREGYTFNFKPSEYSFSVKCPMCSQVIKLSVEKEKTK